jgi:hypothetical protein
MDFAYARLESHQLRADQRHDFLAIETRPHPIGVGGIPRFKPAQACSPFRQTVIDVYVNVNQQLRYCIKIVSDQVISSKSRRIGQSGDVPSQTVASLQARNDFVRNNSI